MAVQTQHLLVDRQTIILAVVVAQVQVEMGKTLHRLFLAAAVLQRSQRTQRKVTAAVAAVAGAATAAAALGGALAAVEVEPTEVGWPV